MTRSAQARTTVETALDSTGIFTAVNKEAGLRPEYNCSCFVLL